MTGASWMPSKPSVKGCVGYDPAPDLDDAYIMQAPFRTIHRLEDENTVLRARVQQLEGALNQVVDELEVGAVGHAEMYARAALAPKEEP